MDANPLVKKQMGKLHNGRIRPKHLNLLINFNITRNGTTEHYVPNDMM